MLTEKDYCDYEACVVLKELGYVGTGEECSYFGAYFNNGNDIFADDLNNNEIAVDEYLRVPLFLAQKWLREEKQIEVNATYDNVVELHWHWYMKSLTNCNQSISIINHDSYEQALLAGIKETVKILKEK